MARKSADHDLGKLMQNYVALRLHQLVKAPWNYKEEDEALGRKLANNLRRNGQVVNMVVRRLEGQASKDGLPLYEVCDGNHRVDALIAIDAPGAVCYNLGDVSAEEGQRLALELNETRFRSNVAQQAQLMASLLHTYGMDDLVSTMPFSSDEIHDYATLSHFDWNDFAPQDPPAANEPKHHHVEALLTDEQYLAYQDAVSSLAEQLPKGSDSKKNGFILYALATAFLSHADTAS